MNDLALQREHFARITITFDGKLLRAVPGETIAATLIANGILAQGRGKDESARGHYCGMGVCHDCLVTVDGHSGVRACLAKAVDGMDVRSQKTGVLDIGAISQDAAVLPVAALATRNVDILIIGAGPGGLRAALAASRSNASVLVLDERPAPGGQYFKQNASAAAPEPDRQMRDGASLIEAVRSSSAIIESETLVWGVERNAQGSLRISTYARGQASIVLPQCLIIATGAFERSSPMPGWTLPGAMTTGAGQTLLRSYGVFPGRRILVAGNGPLNIQVASELLRSGVNELTLVEAAPAMWRRPARAMALTLTDPRLAFQGICDLAALAASRRCRLLFGHRLQAIEGHDRVEAAIVAPVSGGGAPLRVAVDAVCSGDGFLPASDIPRLLGLHFLTDQNGGLSVVRGDDGSTTQRDVFVVGEAGGFGGAHIAEAMGTLAGNTAARRFGFDPGHEPANVRRDLLRNSQFQTRLWHLFAAEPSENLDKRVLVCRCEAKSLGELQDVVKRHKVTDVATLKRLTRAGMGRCQGKYCAAALCHLVGIPFQEAALPAPQLPVRPVPLAALAVEKPEWGGHNRVTLPDRSAGTGTPLDVSETAIVVIGAGISGLSTALFLAREGHDVVVLDRNPINSGASGANAGSLHAQLLSFDHGAKSEAGGGPAVRTLPLQQQSIALWQELETELGLDFEISITGGLMVAETDAHLAFLAAKTAAERAQGIDCSVIGRRELRCLEPALDTRFIGAAYCPEEGKINPLVATQGIYEAAISAGARIITGVEVTAVERVAAGFLVTTSRGKMHAGRIVNCAGGFAARIGSMLGVNVPVFGAPLQMIVTEAAEPTISRLVAHADRHLTLKQAANGNFVIGGGWTAGLDPVRQHPRPLLDSIEGNLWVAQHVVPSLRKLHVLRTWAAMNINIDGAPILGEHPGIPGFFNCVTSNGYTLGPIMGQITASLVLGKNPGIDIKPFLIQRFG